MPKTYSQYKFEDILILGLNLKSGCIFDKTAPLAPSSLLKQLLELHIKQALATEKAKSEFIIAPILFEIARKNQNSVSFFSGYPLDVDKNIGLKGFCDFLFSKMPNSPIIDAPIFCIAEAKNDNLDKGTPQCIAEMYAARLFNKNKKKPIDVIYGCVTTGYLWQFLRLEGDTILQETTIYSLSDLNKILGILQYIIEQ
jgi:hypothetical protein